LVFRLKLENQGLREEKCDEYSSYGTGLLQADSRLKQNGDKIFEDENKTSS